MSRKLLAFLLNELKIVRVKCLSCGGIIELSPEKVSAQFSSGACPLCTKPISVKRVDENPLCQLSKIIESFKSHEKFMEVEFVLEDKSGQ